MSWRAIFLDGPLEGKRHDCLMFGRWAQEMYFVATPAGPGGWLAVGTDYSPPPPELSGMVHYRRNDDRSQLIKDDTWKPGDDEGWAAFELAE